MGSGKLFHPGVPPDNDYPKSWTEPYPYAMRLSSRFSKGSRKLRLQVLHAGVHGRELRDRPGLRAVLLEQRRQDTH